MDLEKINEEIKSVHDRMLEIKFNNTLNKQELNLEEYKDLKRMMFELVQQKKQMMGGEENDKHKRK